MIGRASDVGQCTYVEPGLLLASVFGDSRSYNTPVGRDRAMRSLKLWAAGEGYNGRLGAVEGVLAAALGRCTTWPSQPWSVNGSGGYAWPGPVSASFDVHVELIIVIGRHSPQDP
jgi:hypothetical protein